MRKVVLAASAFFLLATSLTAQIRFGQFGQKRNEQLELNYTNPREFEIAEITVSGAEFLDKNALISLSGLKVGDVVKIPSETITNAVKKLWKQGIIGDVSISATKIEGGKVYLDIHLTERPRLTKFNFKGLNSTQEKEIREKINLIRGRVLTDAIIKNTELTIKKYFYDKGHLNTTIKIAQERDTLLANSVAINIAVDKGYKIKVNDIYIDGVEAFPEGRMKRKLKSTNERPRFTIIRDLVGRIGRLVKPREFKSFLDSSYEVDSKRAKSYISRHVKLNVFAPSKFISAKYEEDKQSLIDFYNSKGFRDAEIVSDSIYSFDERSVNVNLKVKEGRRYYFRDIIWTGNYVHNDKVLDQVLGVKSGDIYDLELINKKLNFNPQGADISSLYMDNGYLFFSVQPIEVRVAGDSIDVEMRIYEGAQATINKIIITGNDRTNDHVIRRELRTLPGQKFSRAELIRTQRELSQLGYFDPEQVTPNPLPNPLDETVDIEWSLTERPSDQVEVSGGWGGAFGFVGTVGLTFNNFSARNIFNLKKWRPLPVGDGQRFSLRLQANGRQFQSYSISFSEPWLGGRKPNSFGINFSYSIQRSINRFTNETVGSLKVTGLTLSLGRRVTWPDDFFTLSNSISLLNYDLFNFGQSLGFSTGVANNLSFNTTFARNSIDNPMYPRSGSSISLSVSLTPPYSLFRDVDYESLPPEERYKWVEFHKWMFDTKFYTRIAGNLVLEARAHLGWIGSYTDRAGIGPFERFWLGGDGLTGQNFLLGNDIIGLRGYENNSIVPIDPESGIRGGIVYNKYVMELRYPVSLNPSATIYVLGFGEAGNNWASHSEFNPFDSFKSAGFGARIFMPAFGLLGIDWAYGFDTLPNRAAPSGSQIHFSIGQLLR